MHLLEAETVFSSRDKDAAMEALAALRKENDTLTSQQSQWDDLRHTNERLEQLASLVSQAQTNEQELIELRRARDSSKALEGEYAALQRRYKEQETRAARSSRTTSTARTSLAQEQQCAAEWEQRANKNEEALKEAQAMRDQAEDRAAQLEVKHSQARMQLDKKDTEECLAKVQMLSLVARTITKGRFPRAAKECCAARSLPSRHAWRSSKPTPHRSSRGPPRL